MFYLTFKGEKKRKKEKEKEEKTLFGFILNVWNIISMGQMCQLPNKKHMGRFWDILD